MHLIKIVIILATLLAGSAFGQLTGTGGIPDPTDPTGYGDSDEDRLTKSCETARTSYWQYIKELQIFIKNKYSPSVEFNDDDAIEILMLFLNFEQLEKKDFLNNKVLGGISCDSDKLKLKKKNRKKLIGLVELLKTSVQEVELECSQSYKNKKAVEARFTEIKKVLELINDEK